MSIEIQFYNVIIRKKTLEEKYKGGLKKYKKDSRHSFFLEDEYLTRAGFPFCNDLTDFIEEITKAGLAYDKEKNISDDFVVLQREGTSWEVNWLDWDGMKCWLEGTDPNKQETVRMDLSSLDKETEKDQRMKRQEIIESVIREYADVLKSRDVERLVPILHPLFKFVYWFPNDRGHGIRTDIRYIGHLYKTFLAMRKEKISIKADFCTVEVEGVKYFSIKLLPPHDYRIIYPNGWEISKDEIRMPDGEVLLLCKVVDGKLYKVECYISKSKFTSNTSGKSENINLM